MEDRREQLGDGARYVEIVDLNAEILDGRPDFITAGPSSGFRAMHQQPATTERYVVEPGDTLSEIALDELGDATRYPEIFEASRGHRAARRSPAAPTRT